MAIGHRCSAPRKSPPLFLYLSLAIIVCGYGLFKSTSAACLANCKEPTDPRRDGGFASLMYAAGNIGSIIAPIACGYVQEEYSWAMGLRWRQSV